MNVSRKQIDHAIKLVQEKAARKRENASYGGEMGDGGAGRLEQLINAYESGVAGEIPSFLQPFMKEAQKRMDPEFAEYERLKKKFE